MRCLVNPSWMMRCSQSSVIASEGPTFHLRMVLESWSGLSSPPPSPLQCTVRGRSGKGESSCHRLFIENTHCAHLFGRSTRVFRGSLLSCTARLLLGLTSELSLYVCLSIFSVQRRVASARSFNSYPSMLQMRLIISVAFGSRPYRLTPRGTG